MRGLRLFARGVARTIMQRITRRAFSRVRGSSPRRTMRDLNRDSGEIDGLLDDIADQIDVLEILELAAEAPGMISRAKDAAGAGSVGTFQALMGSFNEGQRSLVENYCMPYAEEYWSTVSDPDPDAYINGMYSLHEAIEQALSVACEMSYEGGRTAGASSLVSDLSQYIAEELVVRGFTAAGIRKAQSSWGRFASWAEDMKFGMYDSYMRSGIPEGAMRFRDAAARRAGDYMVIGDKHGSFEGATRQLDWNSFMSRDNQPYWFTESKRMQYANMQGHLSDSAYESKKAELYAKTYNNPYSTSPPSGYRPYSGPEWRVRN